MSKFHLIPCSKLAENKFLSKSVNCRWQVTAGKPGPSLTITALSACVLHRSQSSQFDTNEHLGLHLLLI